MKRSNMIVALGLAVFVVGAAATWFVLRDSDSGASASTGNATVLYAAQAIPAGTSGSTAVDQGMVKTKSVPASAATGALRSPSQLAGKTASSAVAEGVVLTSDEFPQAQTAGGVLKIPDGKTALAIGMDYMPGVAGFAQAGDRVDIFGVSKEVGEGGAARLVLQGTEVLRVSAPTVAAGANGGKSAVFVLAVTPPEAEQVIYLSTFQSIYFSLVPRDQAPVPGTPGSGQPDALTLLP